MPHGPVGGWGHELDYRRILGENPFDRYSKGMCSRADLCRLPACRTPRKRYVYGLWDRHIDNIFYVGSTFSPVKRFLRHIGENEYVLRMIERGSFPIPIVLLEFETRCDDYSRLVEREIADQLRKQGHYAFGDDIWVKRYAEALDDQVRQLNFLREIYSC